MRKSTSAQTVKLTATSIGQILVEFGFCTTDDVDQAAEELDRLRKETRDIRIGMILVNRSKITDAELAIALARQSERRRNGRIEHGSMTHVLQCAAERHREIDNVVDRMTQSAGVLLAKVGGG